MLLRLYSARSTVPDAVAINPFRCPQASVPFSIASSTLGHLQNVTVLPALSLMVVL
ncbi:hypothetical protein ACQ4M4_19210 [Leptolyngbya sp. AN02str]|uniref:hypothetical protein n=1 Tax=Leptolyngbya sp. AN02str TaxID=3423363 RepID=UPI003D31FAD9